MAALPRLAGSHGLILASTTGRPSGSARTTNRPQAASCVGQITVRSRSAAPRSHASGVLDPETNRGPTNARSSWEDSPLVVTSVIAMKHDSSRGTSDNDDDVVLKENGEPKGIYIERSSLGEVRDVQDQAVEAFGLHCDASYLEGRNLFDTASARQRGVEDLQYRTIGSHPSRSRC
jgi:hypothetical protein